MGAKTIDEYLAGVAPEQRAAPCEGRSGPPLPEPKSVSRGTVRVHPESPIPAPLVKKLVKKRLAENLALDHGKKEKSR